MGNYIVASSENVVYIYVDGDGHIFSILSFPYIRMFDI